MADQIDGVLLSRKAFPVTIEAVDPATGKIVWTRTIDAPSPGQLVPVFIPPLARQMGHSVQMVVRTADGVEVRGSIDESKKMN